MFYLPCPRIDKASKSIVFLNGRSLPLSLMVKVNTLTDVKFMKNEVY